MILFEKVSQKQFVADWIDKQGDRETLEQVYDQIPLPKRATAGSAGYDFYLPADLTLAPGESACIPTGIRVLMPAGVVLLLMPRSGLGTRYRLQLANTTGVIDSDYYGALNEGHIQATLTNDSKEGKVLTLAAGDRFMQGIFMPYLLCDDDQTEIGQRLGGLGSTDQSPIGQKR
ncbi:deoxyuridine 5'-triphosphate nucleotidohydrolase [Peptococcus simiae]|uniref:deoxyuridine 5'-triphosphate nucleotidohydrolase n=1 Tax=Peptococcus simiae TaxID=1643805 RepID=UPI003980D151